MESKNYVCPQCGKDERGGYIHSQMFHLWPPTDEVKARKEWSRYLVHVLREQYESPKKKLIRKIKECQPLLDAMLNDNFKTIPNGKK